MKPKVTFLHAFFIFQVFLPYNQDRDKSQIWKCMMLIPPFSCHTVCKFIGSVVFIHSIVVDCLRLFVCFSFINNNVTLTS